MTLRNTVRELISVISDLLFCKKITPEVGHLLISKLMKFTPALDKYEPVEDKKLAISDLYAGEIHAMEVDT